MLGLKNVFHNEGGVALYIHRGHVLLILWFYHKTEVVLHLADYSIYHYPYIAEMCYQLFPNDYNIYLEDIS